MMSGSAYSSWALVDDPVHYAVQLASSLNCTVPRYALPYFITIRYKTWDNTCNMNVIFYHFHSNLRNMVHQHEEILKCLRNKTVAELSKFRFEDNPSFLTAMGPSRDGIIIPADFGLNHGKMTLRQGRSSAKKPFFMKSRSTRKLRSGSAGTYQVEIIGKVYYYSKYIF